MGVTAALEKGDDGAAVMAEVRAGGVTTRYWRAGRGSPVLLLCDAADERFEPLLGRLAADYRVIAPVHGIDGPEASFGADRMAGFLDGLGIASAAVIGLGRAAGPASALARLHGERVGRLVLLGLDVGEPERHVDAALEALARAD